MHQLSIQIPLVTEMIGETLLTIVITVQRGMTFREKEKPVTIAVRAEKLERIERGARAKLISKAVVDPTATPHTRRHKAPRTATPVPSHPTISPWALPQSPINHPVRLSLSKNTIHTRFNQNNQLHLPEA